MIEDGTAIGSAIATSMNRLRSSTAKSKIIILLTDGRNNAGRVDPITAADASAALNVKIYTIGAGTKGLAPFPVRDFFGNKVYQQVKVEIDDESLMNIAQKTGGRYFRATDTESLIFTKRSTRWRKRGSRRRSSWNTGNFTPICSYSRL
jgi:Ca-activated chloride channel family protein